MNSRHGQREAGMGQQSQWEGSEWVGGTTAPTPAAVETPVGGEEHAEPILRFSARLDDTPIEFAVYEDHLRWVTRNTRLSADKLLAGTLTGGLSLLVTGVGKGSYTVDRSVTRNVLPFASVTEVTSNPKRGQTEVTLSTFSRELKLLLPRKEATHVTQVLNNLMLAAKSAPVVPPVNIQIHGEGATASPTPSAALHPSPQGTIKDLQHLAELHRQGLLNDDEFSEAKRRLLGM